ncbi:MAG: prolyl oligopeptidase family serine peptidase [Pseudomonadota bacterium]
MAASSIQSAARLAAVLAAVLLTSCAGIPRLSPDRYPQSPRGDVVDDYHGTAVADPYRWLEQLDSAATQGWIAAQNALSAPYLVALPGRAAIVTRLGELINQERFGVPVKAGSRYFFLRNDGTQNQAALHVAASPTELGTRLIDPNTIRGDATVSLADYEPSPDGRLLAYALSDSGSDWKTWRVRDVATGEDLDDVLRDTKFTRASWLRDSSGFYYSRYPGGDDKKQPVIHLHRIGTMQAEDREIFAVSDHPTRVPEGVLTLDGRYLVIVLDEGTLSNGISVLRLDGAGRVEPLFNRYDGLYTYLGSRDSAGTTELLFATTAAAPNGKVIAVDMGKPAGSRERLIVPEGKAVLARAALVGNRVVVSHLTDAHAQVRLFNAATAQDLGVLTLPGLGEVGGFTGDADSTESFYSYTDFFTPTRIYRLGLDGAPGESRLLHAPRLAADTSGYITEQVFYPSKDGTRVPMFIVHRRDLKRDGSNPVMLYGYGGFDISMTPLFSAGTLTWLEMGGVYVLPNLRGGGEYGAAWHVAGTRANKQNVFDDFIAAAEYLISKHYTRPGRIVIRGGSNGGLLVGATLTQRPELFGAALPEVGVLDMLRYHLASANARQWSDDFGLSEDATDFRAQYAYSPYHNVQRHHCYPPTLVTTAQADNRVVPWHSYKFTAALQQAQRCANPALIRVETRAGHGAGRPIWMQIEQTADEWAFAANALKMPPATFPQAP